MSVPIGLDVTGEVTGFACRKARDEVVSHLEASGTMPGAAGTAEKAALESGRILARTEL